MSLDDKAITPQRLAGRRSLLGQLDDLWHKLDHDDATLGMDSFTQRAFEVLSSRRVFEALDLTKEDPGLRARYGIGDMNNEADGPPCCMDHFLMARRLVEAGARVVTISFGRWDTHSRNFETCKARIPKLDMALSTLVEDLYDRGLDKDVSVVVWGEFGRTPKINKNAGRDHWPAVNFAFLAGGGMRTGQVIGATDKEAAYVKERPVSFQNVFATLYHNLGIDPAHRRLRPQRPADVPARRAPADPRVDLRRPRATASATLHPNGGSARRGDCFLVVGRVGRTPRLEQPPAASQQGQHRRSASPTGCSSRPIDSRSNRPHREGRADRAIHKGRLR